ncbi:glutathione synthase [Inmirania thermothiophila]|uniref:Glutathione synthetase n=1 Tax=Inmirania thermothiophila TaxID=1750597 RepID=A0A3N1Y6N8_9GAMM|nr:glutathione synthase [Inmirania thermothiophila]ROR34178.1 glutathione synthase [Inmirania thermothiophila]
MRLGVVMDPIGSIHFRKDSTLAMLLAARRRGHELLYMELGDLYLEGAEARARMRPLEVFDDPAGWYRLGEAEDRALASLDAVLMRKDPPVDPDYLYATHVLEHAERAGACVVNRPAALREANEKLAALWFPELCPPTRVARDPALLRAFLERHGDAVVKPLDAMGGESVFRVRLGDPNVSVILETITGRGRRFAMIQRYLPAIAEGDKRILLIDGEPVPYALARVPAPGELRGNLAAGGTGVGVELGAAERAICARVGPELARRGLLFVGLDVIGDRLTEVNVTSPTCIRELERIYGLDIAGTLIARIEDRVAGRRAAGA